MGCDIHVFLERRVEDRWVMVNTLTSNQTTNRNYDRFAKLAGVRGDGPEPRGIPADVSESVKLHISDWEGDGHSHSWMSLREATPIFRGSSYERFSDPEWIKDEESAIYHFFGSRASRDPDNHRIVFFFDN